MFGAHHFGTYQSEHLESGFRRNACVPWGAAFIGSARGQETFIHLLKRWEWRCVCKSSPGSSSQRFRSLSTNLPLTQALPFHHSLSLPGCRSMTRSVGSYHNPPHLPKFVQNVQFTETLLYSGNVQAERGEGCAEPPAAGGPGVADGPCRPECGHLAPLHTGLSLCPCGLSSFRKEDNLSKHGREPGWLRGCKRAEFFIFLSFLMVLRRQNYLSVWRESVKCGG